MEAIIIPKDEFEDLVTKVDVIHQFIEKFTAKPRTERIGNKEFLRIMNVSKSCAQNWRDKQIIPFTKIGNTIYYDPKDVERLLSNKPDTPDQTGNKKPGPKPTPKPVN
jgi:hypothetical protein